MASGPFVFGVLACYQKPGLTKARLIRENCQLLDLLDTQIRRGGKLFFRRVGSRQLFYNIKQQFAACFFVDFFMGNLQKNSFGVML